MTSFIDQLISFVSAHAWLAYLTIFLAALLEAVPIVGSVIPGSTIILALSALVPGGELDIVGVFAAAIAGAALGDGTAFWIGHRSQREILSAWPMSRYPNVIAQSEAFFHRWGRWRYSSRASCRRSAPSCRSPPARWGCRRCASIAINIAAILLWAPAHILPGVLAVSALDRAGGLAGLEGSAKHYWMPLVLGGALIVALAVWVIRRRRGGNAIEPARARVQAQRRPCEG